MAAMLSSLSSVFTIHPPPLSRATQPFLTCFCTLYSTICAGIGVVVWREVARRAATATLPGGRGLAGTGNSSAWRAGVAVGPHLTASAEAVAHVSTGRWYREATTLKVDYERESTGCHWYRCEMSLVWRR